MSNQSVASSQIWTALQLGWTLVEVYGRLLAKPLPHTQSSDERLFLSDLNPSDIERLWLATRRLTALVDQLFPLSQEDDETASKSYNEIIRYPEEINELLERLNGQIQNNQGKSLKTLQSEELYQKLNHWSRQIRSALEIQSFMLAEAATVGAGLADTFWYLPYPLKHNEKIWQTRYGKVLKPDRMSAIIRRIRHIEAYLPPHVGPSLRHSLWEWGIYGRLSRSSKKKLKIAYPILYYGRSWHWLNKSHRTRTEKDKLKYLSLHLNEKQHLWQRLKRQYIKWEELVFEYPPAYFLDASGWRKIYWLTFAIWSLTILGIVAIIIALFALIVVFNDIFILLFALLRPSIATPTSFEDQLTLITITLTALAIVWTQFRHFINWLPNLWGNIRGWVLMRVLEQNTLVLWTWAEEPEKRVSKRLFLICLQRLFFAAND